MSVDKITYSAIKPNSLLMRFFDAAHIRFAFFDALRTHRVFLSDASLSVKVEKIQL